MPSKALSKLLLRQWFLEIVSEQKIAAREGLHVQLEVKRENERTNQMGRETCKDTALPGEI